MRNRNLHKVTCKAALYSPDGKQVLLSVYGDQDYGLPGGHIDEGENPDQAMARELFEELGLENIELKHADFTIHHNGKIILGYTGVLDKETPLSVQEEELEGAIWANVDQVQDGTIPVPSYDDFICKFRP